MTLQFYKTLCDISVFLILHANTDVSEAEPFANFLAQNASFAESAIPGVFTFQVIAVG